MQSREKKGNAERYSVPIRRMLLRTMFRRVMIYLSIALLEIVLLTPVYMLAYKGTRDSERKYIENAMTSNLRAFFSDMDALDRYIYALMQEDSITYLAHIADHAGLHIAEIRELYGAIQRSTILHSSYLDDLIVQFENSDYMIVSGSITKRSNYYGFMLEYENYDQSAYEDLLFSLRQRLLPVQIVETESIRSKRAITFNYFGSAQQKGRQYAISAIICEDTLLDTLVTESVRTYGCFRLFDSDGNMLLNVGEQTEEMDMFEAISDSNGRFWVQYGVDTCVYDENMHTVRLLIGVYCVLAFGIAALYSIFLTTRSVHDFQSVMRILDEAHLGDVYSDSSARNLNDFVNEMLKKQMLRADEVEASLKKTQKRYWDEMLFSLMRGSYHAEKADLEMLKENSVFQDSYLVMELCMLDDAATTIEMKEESNRQAAALFERYMPTLYAVSKRPFVAIMPLQTNSHALIQSVCEEIGRHVVPVCVAVSAPHKGIGEMEEAYQEARMVRRNKHLFMINDDCCMRFDVFSKQFGDSEMLALDADNTFARLIADGRRADLEKRLETMNRHFERLALCAPQRISASYYNVINMLESFYRSLHLPVNVREYDPEMSIAEIEEYLRETVLDVSARMAEQKEKIEPHDGIVNYVSEHFADSGMSLGMLSKEFNLSEAYISRIIKRCTGMNYTDYLERLRMKKAEELLVTTQLSVGEIAARLGYDNQNTFFKAFKRCYQISPGTYRESCMLSGVHAYASDKDAE